MSDTKKLAQFIFIFGLIGMVVSTGFWIIGDRTISDMDMILLMIDVGFLGLIGKIVYILEKMNKSINNQEKR